MSMTIYISGNISTSELSDKDIIFIENIKNIHDEKAFEVGLDSVSFIESSQDACTPFEDDVIDPLEQLIAYFKEQNIKSSGQIFVECPDYRDYDNICVSINNNEINYLNSQIVQATAKELIDELKARGVITDNNELNLDDEELEY